MADLIATVSRLTDSDLRVDDSRVDRLSHRYTSTILIMFAILVSTSAYVSNPIECWAPVHFKGLHVQYANSYCWVSGTFHLPFNSSIPKTPERYTMPRANYYQWVPVILLVQAALFNIPWLLWVSLSERSGININSFIITGQMLITVQMTKAIRDGLLQRMILQMTRYLASIHIPRLSATISLKHLFSRSCCFLCGHREGNYLISLYIVIKILYLINSLAQLFALDIFLGHEYYMYGVEVIAAAVRIQSNRTQTRNAVNSLVIEMIEHFLEINARPCVDDLLVKFHCQGEDWTGSHRFPRVNLCDFKVRRMGNVHQHTLQCVLPINLFNEKIFLFLWFWLLFVTLVIFFDLLSWCLRSFVPLDRTRFIKRHLMLAGDITVDDPSEKKKQAVVFTEKHLRQDGVLLLRLLEDSTNLSTTMELTSKLWNNFIQSPPDNNNEPETPVEKQGDKPTLKIPWGFRVPPRTPTAPSPPLYENVAGSDNSTPEENSSRESGALLESEL